MNILTDLPIPFRVLSFFVTDKLFLSGGSLAEQEVSAIKFVAQLQ